MKISEKIKLDPNIMLFTFFISKSVSIFHSFQHQISIPFRQDYRNNSSSYCSQWSFTLKQVKQAELGVPQSEIQVELDCGVSVWIDKGTKLHRTAQKKL